MSHKNHSDSHHGLSHVMSIPMMLSTFAALIFFTLLTVWSAQFDLGRIDIAVVMLIATVKASLVAVYFMHLRYDKPFNVLCFLFSLCFMALFITITLIDSTAYQADIQEYSQQQLELMAE